MNNSVSSIDVEVEAALNRLSSTSSFYKETVPVTVESAGDGLELPKYAHDGDACIDLRAHRVVWFNNAFGKMSSPDDIGDVVFNRGCTALVDSGIKIALPPGYGAYVFLRSGFSTNGGFCLLNGTGIIDNTYRGNIMLPIAKISSKPYKILKDERIAQLMVFPQIKIDVRPGIVNPTEIRNTDGLGSSGKE